MKKYILNIIDMENGGIHFVLLFDDVLELQRAKDLIKNVDKKQYEYLHELNYCDYAFKLLEVLDENLINYTLPELERIYV